MNNVCLCVREREREDSCIKRIAKQLSGGRQILINDKNEGFLMGMKGLFFLLSKYNISLCLDINKV